MVFMEDVGVHIRGVISFEKLLQRFRSGLPDDVGAIACFVGVVRGRTVDGRRVKRLLYECADDVPEQFRRIVRDAGSRPGIKKVAIHHVVDGLSPGEDTLYVMVAGRGRAEVFSVLREIVERVKSEAHIWKKEITESGEYWVHEKEQHEKDG
ncbi:MAG: molybdenum cofactor biosynthesis protein MoaE [Candidatus Hadarchaeales archaeon]